MHGFNPNTSINLVSTCRDEICRPFTEKLDRIWGSSFNISSLAGFCFCGRTGFKAAMAHAPVPLPAISLPPLSLQPPPTSLPLTPSAPLSLPLPLPLPLPTTATQSLRSSPPGPFPRSIRSFVHPSFLPSIPSFPTSSFSHTFSPSLPFFPLPFPVPVPPSLPPSLPISFFL